MSAPANQSWCGTRNHSPIRTGIPRPKKSHHLRRLVLLHRNICSLLCIPSFGCTICTIWRKPHSRNHHGSARRATKGAIHSAFIAQLSPIINSAHFELRGNSLLVCYCLYPFAQHGMANRYEAFRLVNTKGKYWTHGRQQFRFVRVERKRDFLGCCYPPIGHRSVHDHSRCCTSDFCIADPWHSRPDGKIRIVTERCSTLVSSPLILQLETFTSCFASNSRMAVHCRGFLLPRTLIDLQALIRASKNWSSNVPAFP